MLRDPQHRRAPPVRFRLEKWSGSWNHARADDQLADCRDAACGAVVPACAVGPRRSVGRSLVPGRVDRGRARRPGPPASPCAGLEVLARSGGRVGIAAAPREIERDHLVRRRAAPGAWVRQPEGEARRRPHVAERPHPEPGERSPGVAVQVVSGRTALPAASGVERGSYVGSGFTASDSAPSFRAAHPIVDDGQRRRQSVALPATPSRSPSPAGLVVMRRTGGEEHRQRLPTARSGIRPPTHVSGSPGTRRARRRRTSSGIRGAALQPNCGGAAPPCLRATRRACSIVVVERRATTPPDKAAASADVLRLRARDPQHAVVDDERAEGQQRHHRHRDVDQHGAAIAAPADAGSPHGESQRGGLLRRHAFDVQARGLRCLRCAAAGASAGGGASSSPVGAGRKRLRLRRQRRHFVRVRAAAPGAA